MITDVMEKLKEVPGALRQGPVPVTGLPDTAPVMLKPPLRDPDPEAALALKYRRLQEAAAAREKKMLAEFEVKSEMLYKRLEETFAQKEKKLIEELQAGHAAERRRFEQAALDREQVLIGRLAAARRQLFFVIVAALVSVVAVFNYKVKPKDAAAPVLTSPAGTDQGMLGQPLDVPLFLPTVSDKLVTVPAGGGAVQAPAAKVEIEVAPVVVRPGNRGNFAGGNLRGK